MPTLTIDNRKIDVPAGTKVIAAAERLGIMIPRFCYHPALGSVGACRVCAVAFTDGPVKGVQMSCMIDAQEGMVVSTTDAEAVDFRRHVIEFLMLNHPHDCPVCDEGGHCLLQDHTVSGGHGLRRYRGLKRTHHNQDLGPLVQHEMNRCIQCYRCSRYYQEYTGYRDLGVMGIGSRVYFGRSRSGALESPFSGNLTDICPTGVYTDKPSRYFGRRWDYQRQASLCIHCSLGCNTVASARYRQVVRHEARPNLAVNGYFICDRGRYAYPYASAVDRPRQARLEGTPAAMGDVLAAARSAIERTTGQYGPGSVAVAASSRSSLETLAMVGRACGEHGWTGPAVAATPRQASNLAAAVGGLIPALAVSLADVSAAADVLVIGADPINEAPMLALSLRQVWRQGGRVTVVDPRGVQLPFRFDHWAVHPSHLGAVLQAMIEQIGGRITAPAADATPPGATEAFPVATLARRLNGSPRPVIVCGTDIVTSRDIRLAADLARALSRTHIKVGLFYTLVGANAFAAALTAEPLLSLSQVLEHIEAGQVRALVAVESDLWRGFPDRTRLQSALKRLDHLVVLDDLDSPLNHGAGQFLPTQPIYESGGHWINQEGRLQAADAVMAPGDSIAAAGDGDHPPRAFGRRVPGDDPLPAWRAVASLARSLSADPVQQLNAAMAAFHPAVAMPAADAAADRIDLAASSFSPGTVSEGLSPPEIDTPADAITLLLVDWTFGTESLSAMSPVLQALSASPVARMHPDTIAGAGLAANLPVRVTARRGELQLPLQADPTMARGVLVVPRHHLLNWQELGDTRLSLESSRVAPLDP